MNQHAVFSQSIFLKCAMLGYYEAWAYADEEKASFYRLWDEALAAQNNEQLYKDWDDVEKMEKQMHDDWDDAEKMMKRKKRKKEKKVSTPVKKRKKHEPKEVAKDETSQPVTKVKEESETENSSWQEPNEKSEWAHYKGAKEEEYEWDQDDWQDNVKKENEPIEVKVEPAQNDVKVVTGGGIDPIGRLREVLLDTLLADAVIQAKGMTSVPHGLQTKAQPPLVKAMPTTPVHVAPAPSNCTPPWQSASLPPPPVPPPKKEPVPEPIRPPMCKVQLPLQPEVVHQQVNQKCTGKAGKHHEGYYYVSCS